VLCEQRDQDAELEAAVQMLPSLLTIRVDGRGNPPKLRARDNSVRALVQYLPSLTELQLSWCALLVQVFNLYTTI